VSSAVLPKPETSRTDSLPLARTTKRLVDIFLSALCLVLSGPLLAVLAGLVKVDSRGPVLYWAPRAGKDGAPFPCCKIRTMVVGADRRKDEFRAHNERQGPIFKLTNDPRVTRVGRFLRRYSLDEIPQLWNVLKGEMSLVGPRPHPIDEYERYEAWHRRRLEVTPGLTGLWQVTARCDPSFQRNMQLDLEYIERWSLALDLRILCRTAGVVLAGTGK
jgi:lipopolysaccharide/colanic/teichoic acid biosynthesis glycosyltransferase